MKTLLTFNLEATKKNALKKLAREQDIHIIEVMQVDYSQKLGYLAGISGFERTKSGGKVLPIPMEMMVFSGFSSRQMDEFLAAYKKAGIAPIRLKAAITATNIFWTPVELFSEILRESIAMDQRRS